MCKKFRIDTGSLLVLLCEMNIKQLTTLHERRNITEKFVILTRGRTKRQVMEHRGLEDAE